MNKVYLGLGSNLGDRATNLQKALKLIESLPRTNILKKSKVYQTEPWGYSEQNSFLNMCIKIETDLIPENLLYKCQWIEKKLKRQRGKKWGPRTIDVDILLYNDLILDTEDLIIPHPLIQERAFVLVPLRDLDKDLIINNRKIDDCLKQVNIEGMRVFKK